MQRKIRSTLDELDMLLSSRDRESVLETRALNVIQSAINLVNLMRENYSRDVADDLERRLVNSIRGQDSSKFSRGIRKLKGCKDED